METKDANSIIHFQDVDKIDWISNNFINSRGARFVAPIRDDVLEFMPVYRPNLTSNLVVPCPSGFPAIFVCQKIFIDNGVRYGVIDFSVRTVKYSAAHAEFNVSKTYSIVAGDDSSDPTTVYITETTSEIRFRIIDQDTVNKTITYIDA